VGAGCFPFVDIDWDDEAIVLEPGQLGWCPTDGEYEARELCRYDEAMPSLYSAVESVLTPLPEVPVESWASKLDSRLFIDRPQVGD
jgi:hypothetical protein